MKNGTVNLEWGKFENSNSNESHASMQIKIIIDFETHDKLLESLFEIRIAMGTHLTIEMDSTIDCFLKTTCFVE